MVSPPKTKSNKKQNKTNKQTNKKKLQTLFLRIFWTCCGFIRDHTFMTSMKNVQFLHTPPSPLFLSVLMGPDWTRCPHPWTSKLRLPTNPPPPTPHPLWYSCSISIIFSRRFNHIACPCNSHLFTTKLI